MRYPSTQKQQKPLAFTLLAALVASAAITACTPKPSTEENKVLVEQAVAEAKKQILADQAAEKAKQDAIAAAQAEEKMKHDAAVEEAKKELLAEQQAACPNCGEVLSVKRVVLEGQGSGLGAVGGGVVGGVVGNQIGNGSGRDIATFAGVVGGAIIGNKIEKNSKRTVRYDIAVRMDSGEVRTIRQSSAPYAAPGDKVRIVNGEIFRK